MISLFQTGCVEHDIGYYGSNIYDEGDKIANTEVSCQKACQEHSICSWWSLNLISKGTYGCWLKTEKNLEKREAKIGGSFGPKYCGIQNIKMKEPNSSE